jgi:hypothetical protein
MLYCLPGFGVSEEFTMIFLMPYNVSEACDSSSIPKYLLSLTFTLILTIRIIQKN